MPFSLNGTTSPASRSPERRLYAHVDSHRVDNRSLRQAGKEPLAPPPNRRRKANARPPNKYVSPRKTNRMVWYISASNLGPCNHRLDLSH
jgi:hypothetical protein